MSDPAAQAQPAVPPAIPSLEDRQIAASRARDEARQSRRASAVAKINASHAAEASSEQAAPIAPSAPAPKPAPVAAKPTEAPKPVEDKPAELVKPADTAADEAAAQRGLAQIEQARKRFLDERSAAQAELEVQRAEIARLRQEAQGKVTSIDEMKKLDLPTLLDKLGLDDARLAQLSRESYYRTTEGQKNPSAKQAVEEIRQRSSVSTMEQQIAELRRELAETKESAAAAQKLVFQREYANEWTEGALKEVPADKPTHFAKLYAKDPRSAKQQLLIIGGEIEKETGAAPAPSAVLAEYEKRERAFLESRGYDPDLVLAPPPVASATATTTTTTMAKPTRTLDAGATTQITRADALPTTREERRSNAIAKIRMRQRSTADQVQ